MEVQRGFIIIVLGETGAGTEEWRNCNIIVLGETGAGTEGWRNCNIIVLGETGAGMEGWKSCNIIFILGETGAGMEGWRSCNICLEDMADSDLITHIQCNCIICRDCLERSIKHQAHSHSEILKQKELLNVEFSRRSPFNQSHRIVTASHFTTLNSI